MRPVAHTEAEKNQGCRFRARSLRENTTKTTESVGGTYPHQHFVETICYAIPTKKSFLLERPRLEAGAGVSARQSRHVGDSPLAETPSPSLEFGQKLFGMELELQFREPPRRLWGLTPPIHQSKKNYISEPDPYGKSPRSTESA